MSERKNIERLFQEKFKDFEVVPEPKVWLNIEAELKKKKKRRVIPIWFRLSGVAAILLIGFSIGNGIFQNQENTIIEITNKENSVNKKSKKNQILPINNKESVATSNTEVSSDFDNLNEEKKSVEKNNPEKNSIGTENVNSKVKKKNTFIYGSKKYLNNAIVSHTKQNNSFIKKSQNAKNASDDSFENKNIASNSIADNQAEKENKFERELIINPEKETKNITNTSIAFDTEAFDTQKKDSAAVATAEPNALEELLKEKETKPVPEANLNRWQITSNVAPIYFSSASNGSPIDAQFADNDKTYEKNLSYGVGVNYALNKKWSVKGGINKLTLGYNTNDIVYYASLPMSTNATNSGGISTNGYVANSSGIIIENNSAENILSFDNIQEKTPGYINQTMGFIEVPVEVSYKLLDRKFGIEIIGGMSTMFLNENSLSVVSNGMQASMGKAENLNDVSFTSNIGLGFKYKFWKSFEANIEPKFKYQLNTFSENSGGFKPYFIGLYSGINFNF